MRGPISETGIIVTLLNWLKSGSTGLVRRRRILVFSGCLEEAWIQPSVAGHRVEVDACFSGQTVPKGVLATGGLVRWFCCDQVVSCR